MSEAKRQLVKIGRELELLLQDLRASDYGRFPAPPFQPMNAPKSLGAETAISFIAFVEYLAALWIDWVGLLRRWQRYTGHSEEDVPARFRRLYDRAREEVQRLLDDTGIRLELQLAWQGDFGQRLFFVRSFENPRAALHAILEADSRLRMVRRMRRQPNWGEIDLAARQFDEQVQAAFNRSPLDLQEDVQLHLGHYRHTLLRLSWLEQSEPNDAYDGSRLLRSEPMKPDWTKPVIDLADLNEQTRGIAGEALSRIATAIGELGYDAFVADISADDFHGGPDSAVGANVNLIPSRPKGNCASVLVVVSKGRSRTATLGFTKSMQAMKTHLIQCAGITKTVIVLCDTWDAQEFADEHFAELEAHQQRGVRFVFLLVGSPRNRIAPLAVGL